MASSYPPGTTPTVLPSDISLFMLEGLTACTPQSLPMRPKMGTARINRLPSPIMVDSLLESTFIFEITASLMQKYSKLTLSEDASRRDISPHWRWAHHRFVCRICNTIEDECTS